MAQADAQYVIDIAANMGEGENTIAELDTLTEKLTGAGKNAEFFQAAIKKVSADLQTATAATAAANDALAQGNAKYAELEQAAAQAAKEVEKIGKSSDRMSLAYLEAAQKSHDAAIAVDEQAKALAGLEKNAKKAEDEEAKLSQTLGNVKKLSAHADKAFARQAESLEKLGSGIGAIPGPVGDLGQSLLKPIQGFTKLSGSMGESGAAAVLAAGGIAALVAAVVAVTAAVVVGAVKLAAWAVGLSDTARAADLASQAFNVLNPEVSFLGPRIDDLADSTGVAKKDLQGLAAGLSEAGVATDDLSNALEAAALAEAAGGKGASAKYIALEKAADDARKAVDAFAKKSGGAVSKELTDKLAEAEQAAADFAGRAKATRAIVDKQLQGTGKQAEKLQKNFSEIFSGLNTDSVERGLKIIADLFDKDTESGRAMQQLFESVFQPLIDQAENAAVAVEAFVLGFLIGATKLYIKIKPVIRAVSELFGLDDTGFADTLDLIATAGEAVAYIFAGFVVTLGLVAAAFGVLAAPIAAVVGAVYEVIKGIVTLNALLLDAFLGAWESVKSFFASLDLAEIGRQMIAGLVSGITSAAGAVLNAITGAVGGAINAAKKLLGIASPSKVFEDFGDMTGEGFVLGVEAQNDNAQQAMTAMVEPDLPPAPFAGVTSANTGGAPTSGAAGGDAAAGAGSDAGGGPSVTVNLQGAQISFSGLKDAPQGVEQFAEMLTKVWKGDAATLGNSVEEKGKAA